MVWVTETGYGELECAVANIVNFCCPKPDAHMHFQQASQRKVWRYPWCAAPDSWALPWARISHNSPCDNTQRLASSTTPCWTWDWYQTKPPGTTSSMFHRTWLQLSVQNGQKSPPCWAAEHHFYIPEAFRLDSKLIFSRRLKINYRSRFISHFSLIQGSTSAENSDIAFGLNKFIVQSLLLQALFKVFLLQKLTFFQMFPLQIFILKIEKHRNITNCRPGRRICINALHFIS